MMKNTMTAAEARKAYKRALAREIRASKRHEATSSPRSLAAYAAASEATNAAIRAWNAAVAAEETAAAYTAYTASQRGGTP